MWNEPSTEDLVRLPTSQCAKRRLPAARTIYDHFFLNGSDWYVAAYDPQDGHVFGYVVHEGRRQDAGWYRFSLNDLRTVNIKGVEIDRDRGWKPCKAGKIERIRNSGGAW